MIAQASVDLSLANTRAAVLRIAGYNVRTFMSADELALACANQKFDLLLVGHFFEYGGREEMCASFRKHNPGSPILQLQCMNIVPTTADYSFTVDEGPEALVTLLNEILLGRKAKVGD
jgi:hypothetical protein